MAGHFDVYLSHNRRAKTTVKRPGEALRERGLRVWLDAWEQVPGRPWQEALEEIIETTRAAAVLVGSDGLGPWEEREMRPLSQSLWIASSRSPGLAARGPVIAQTPR